MPISTTKLIEWVTAAQNRARLVWATGVSSRATAGDRVADLVTALGDKGFVTAHFQKVEGQGRYLVQRTARKPMAGELAQLLRDLGPGKAANGGRPSTSLGMSGRG